MTSVRPCRVQSKLKTTEYGGMKKLVCAALQLQSSNRRLSPALRLLCFQINGLSQGSCPKRNDVAPEVEWSRRESMAAAV